MRLASAQQNAAEADQKGAAVLGKLHSYYGQFLPSVEHTTSNGLAPLEKSLQVSVITDYRAVNKKSI